MERRGAFVVALHALRWRPNAATNDSQDVPTDRQDALSLWVTVAVDGAPDGVWFGPDDDNVMTSTVQVSADTERVLDYNQSSRSVELNTEALTALLHAQLRIAVYAGSTQSRATDEFWGEAHVAFMPALLSERLQDTISIVNKDVVSIELSVQCDADLADFALGLRVLRLQSLKIVRPPHDWTLPSANDEEAMRLCAAPDRNTAIYELEIPLPNFGNDESQSTEVVRFTGGKLQYEPNPSAMDDADATAELRGEWSILFSVGAVYKPYLKSAIPRLLEFLQVEKTVTAVLRRSSVEAVGRVTAMVSLNLHGLTTPGQTQLSISTVLKTIHPMPKETLEQELASAASNDEKKRLQALLNDYEASFVQAAVDLSSTVRAAKTRVECEVTILGPCPLVLEPPPTPTPTRTIDELIPMRDLSDEHDQRKDTVADLRTEIRCVVLTVLREFEDTDAVIASASRDDKRQRIVFKLNSQGAYHEFKEKLKKRIVPLIRDQFADEVQQSDSTTSEDDGEKLLDGKGLSGVNTKKKTYFATVYAKLMDEVQRVLHETFGPSARSSLEKAHGDLLPRDEAKVTQELTTLGLRALENEVNGDVDKSEALHLERIAFAEERSIETPHLALRPSLGTVWFDYAAFCLGQGEHDKAGGALRQCLSLEPHSVPALLAYGALLCELQDWAAADIVIKNVVSEALEQAADGNETSALDKLATAHALLALYFSQSQADETGNLVLFELLKAQCVLRRIGVTEPCLSAVWIDLAAYLHALRLRGSTQMALHLINQYHRPRDVLTASDRVLQRVISAEGLSLRGEGERATVLLREALEIDRTNALAWLVLGKTYLQLESQSITAIECLQRSLEHKRMLRTDRRLSLYMHLGLVLLQSSQFAVAKATFLMACEEFTLASAWLGVGIASLRLEQWDSAEIALAEANRLDATNPEVWGYLALLALSVSPRVTTQYEQRARHSVTQALRFQLSNPVLLRELSSGFVAIDRLEDAERLLRRALVLQDSSLTRKTLADVLAAQNCAEDALTQYKQSLDESQDVPQRCELLEKCATLLGTLGRPDEAAECRRMATQLQVEDSPEEKQLDGVDP